MKKVLFCLFISIAAFYGCAEKSEIINHVGNTTKLEVTLQNLPQLPDTLVYNLWVVTQSGQRNLGVIKPQGGAYVNTFSSSLYEDYYLSSFRVSIEPANEDSAGGSRLGTLFLEGEFQANNASLEIPEAAEIKTATGKYQLFTPTDLTNPNGKSGIWFVDTLKGAVAKGLTLPALSANWNYEGFVVINNQTLSTGKFTDLFGKKDMDSTYSGVTGTPTYPGEDFLRNAPGGLTFPTDLSGQQVYITINLKVGKSQVFSGKVLSAAIPSNAAVNTPYSFQAAGETFPGGTVKVVVE